MARINRAGREYRRWLEDRVIEHHGRIDEEQAHVIDEAVECELDRMVCRWLFRQKLDGMDVAQVLACSRQGREAVKARNRAVLVLKIGAAAIDPWASLALPMRHDSPDASGSTQGDLAEPDIEEEAADAAGDVLAIEGSEEGIE